MNRQRQMGRDVMVDLTCGRVVRGSVDPLDRRRFLGGRGLTMATLLARIEPDLGPLVPDAPLLLSAGPLVGTGFPGGARFNVSARSPQTGILGDSNAGGFFGSELRFAGVDRLTIEGAANRPSLLVITDDDIRLVDAKTLWGLDVVETTEAVHAMLGDHRVRVAAIGPAAENGVAFAGIFADLVRAAARTGMGAVLASKNLKAIAVRGTRAVPIADPDRFAACLSVARDRIREHPEYEIRTRLGTTQLVTKLNAIGGLPTRHFQSGTFEHADAVSGERIEVEYKVCGKACFACTIPCSRQIVVDDERYPGLSFEGPEYEPLAGFTARVGVADLPLALFAVDRCNRLGLDAISTSEVIAWAMECTERGWLDSTVTGRRDLRFGNGGAVLELIEAIARREGFGDVLADGVRSAAETLGVGRDLAMEVKGLELFQADVRAMKGYGLGNAVASRGADHLRSEPWFEFSGDREEGVRRYGVAETSDRLAWRGKGLLVKDYEERAAIADALGICKNIYNNMEIWDWEDTAAAVNAVLGEDLTGEEIRLAGERIVNAERLINARLGIGRGDDRLPQRFLEEPAGPPDSLSAGSVVELEPMLDEYYEARGWDRRSGLPTAAKLRELGLEE